MTCRFKRAGFYRFEQGYFIVTKTEVILTENIVGLGSESDKVEVAAGYARNYLLPQGRAIPAGAANARYLEALQVKRVQRETQDLTTMQALKESLDKLPPLVIKVKAGETGKLFGSVTVGMICDGMKNQFDVELDKRNIGLDQPIRDLGDHEVELKLHSDISGLLKVKVESENPLPELEKELKSSDDKKSVEAKES